MKALVYSTPVNDVQILQDIVFNAYQHLQKQPSVFQKVRELYWVKGETL